MHFTIPAPLPDALLADAAQKQAAEKIERERKDAAKYTADNLRARSSFTLANFRRDIPVMVCEIDGRPATLNAAISAVLEGKSALILGATRSGKSHLAVAIARETGKRAVRIKDFELATLYEINRFRPEEKYKIMLDRALDCDILVYDDAGKNACAHGASTTPFGNVVFGIFDYRIEHGRQTIVTSRYLDRDLFAVQIGADLLGRMELRDRAGTHHVFIIFGDK